MRRRDTALAVLVALIWGTNFVAIRTGLDSVPPLLFLAVRFVVVCVPAVFFVRRPGLPWRDLALIGLFTSLGQFALMYLALNLGMPPGLSSLVLQAQVLLTVVIASVWLREKPSTAQRVGVALGGAGLVTIAVGRGLTAPLLPLVVLVLAAVSWAVGNVLTRRAGSLTGPGSGLGVTVWSGLVVPVPAVALSLVFEGPGALGGALGHVHWSAVLSTAYTAYLSSLVGYGIWNTLLSRHPVARVTPFAMLVPVFGMAAAALVYDERPHALELVGGLVLLAGVAVAVLRRGRREATIGLPGEVSALVAVDVDPPTGPTGEPADLVQTTRGRTTTATG
ncbi:EamA family transporter [Terrabacter terrigena]|uniref:EamA family transporter n=1 Tax=Terrabacter terrigena TaxID=574718 RepID=A0ABW3MVS4_9MICO